MGKITVIGIGPGSLEDMTPRARKAIEAAEVVAGYNTYIKLVESLLMGKKVIGTAMMQEIDRCRMAVDEAAAGRDTVVVSSGDAGVYGMAGLVLELILQREEAQRPEFGGVIAGVSAVNAAASVLGAPLMHDFAVISLSDLMTPWEKIEKRLRMAAMADFVICIYNPSSRKRADYLKKACLCMMEYKKEDTVCGIVKNIGREGECMKILSLKELSETDVDMFTTVFVGNEETRIIGDKMVTPRGYKNV